MLTGENDSIKSQNDLIKSQPVTTLVNYNSMRTEVGLAEVSPAQAAQCTGDMAGIERLEIFPAHQL